MRLFDWCYHNRAAGTLLTRVLRLVLPESESFRRRFLGIITNGFFSTSGLTDQTNP